MRWVDKNLREYVKLRKYDKNLREYVKNKNFCAEDIGEKIRKNCFSLKFFWKFFS